MVIQSLIISIRFLPDSMYMTVLSPSCEVACRTVFYLWQDQSFWWSPSRWSERKCVYVPCPAAKPIVDTIGLNGFWNTFFLCWKVKQSLQCKRRMSNKRWTIRGWWWKPYPPLLPPFLQFNKFSNFVSGVSTRWDKG